MKRKITCFTFLSVLIFLALMRPYKGKAQLKEEMKLYPQEELLQQNQRLKEYVAADEEFERYFAGSYLDERGLLTVVLTKDAEVKDIRNRYLDKISQNIVVRNDAEFSLDTLQQTMKMIQEKVSELKFDEEEGGFFLSETDNCIYIEIVEESYEKVRTLVDLIPENRCIKTVIVDRKAEDTNNEIANKEGVRATTYINLGQRIKNATQNVGITLGFRAKKGTKLGFVTCAHVVKNGVNTHVDVGDSFTNSTGSALGTVLSYDYYNIDACFVEKNSNCSVSKNVYSDGTSISTYYTRSYLITGMTVYFHGATTGVTQTGTIQSLNYHPLGFPNMYCCTTNITVSGGDSGGPLFAKSSSSSTTGTLIGLLHGQSSTSNYSYVDQMISNLSVTMY